MKVVFLFSLVILGLSAASWMLVGELSAPEPILLAIWGISLIGVSTWMRAPSKPRQAAPNRQESSRDHLPEIPERALPAR